jgi:transmembrane sensor
MDANERRRRASDEAVEWWLQMDSLSKSQREALVDWLRESPIHVAELLRVAQLHNALERFPNWERIAADEEPAAEGTQEARILPFVRVQAPIERPRPRIKTRVFGLAASIVAVALISAWLFSMPRGQVIETQHGQRAEVTLNDGTVVKFDPETRLRVRFAQEIRRIDLERGRALFSVEKDAARPFVVDADGTIVRAMGTAFGIEQRSQAVVVTVAEGKVLVSRTAGARGSPPGNTRSVDSANEARQKSEIHLSANEQVIAHKNGAIGSVRKVDWRQELAWSEGRLVFDNDSIADVVAEFNRYNRLQLQIADDALGKRSISGTFDASDPESFIAFLQTVLPVDVTRNDRTGTITLSTRHQ